MCCGHVRKCTMLSIIFWTIYLLDFARIILTIVGIPMGTKCVSLLADFFCYERDFMLSLSDNNQTDIVETFNILIQCWT